ncbi:hypothetical protein QOZ80_5AG0404590 [Eleusine coracana subsp. coracana]|nr:hypothetical protein QOZ80_5AG0404590 [Eleusine coracana subsp. coracana]
METEDRPPKLRLVLPTDLPESAAVQKENGRSSGPAAYMAEEDIDALDCGVCFVPLKPPIYQCEVGHVVCGTCRDKLEAAAAAGKTECHVCGVAGGYRRCHAMEKVVESVRVPCMNAAYGCTARPAYHDQHRHLQACAHAPCRRCPDAEACGSVGSTTALWVWEHVSRAHIWRQVNGGRPQ